MNEIILSICVITMNREEQLTEALESCISCEIPFRYEFVILDNASTDDTSGTIELFKKSHPEVSVQSFYSEQNLGVGGGRSLVFEKAQGKFVYFLDDDAVIDTRCKKNFFVDSIDFLKNNSDVASLTTQIHDEIFGDSRTNVMSSIEYKGKKKAFFYLGGSHFLRKSCFDIPLYLDIIYGSEEYAPSIRAIDKGYIHVYDESVAIIHKPRVNKWIEGSSDMRNIIIRGLAVVYATKLLLYPSLFKPVLLLGYISRCNKHLKEYSGAKEETDKLVK